MDRQVKQLLNMQKATFDNIMNTAIALWNQAEGAMGTFINMAVWIPEDGKRTLSQWVESGKTGLETFKNAADEAYSKVLSEKEMGGEKPQAEASEFESSQKYPVGKVEDPKRKVKPAKSGPLFEVPRSKIEDYAA